MAYAAKQNFADAIHEFHQAQQISGQDPYLDGLLGFAYGLSGSSGKARKLLKKLRQRSHYEYVPAFSLALIYIGLGNRGQAMELLDQSSSDRSTYMVYAKADPLLDSIRSDPRFSSLLNRMGLA
jgi:Flp pilus assembly protein TadD